MISGHATAQGTARFGSGSAADGANYRVFDGLTLSNVGMGTYLGEPDGATDRMVASAIRESVRAGINVIDTAINYRSQKAERAVGAALAELIGEGIITRDQLFLSTKGGYVTDDADVPLDFWGYVQDQYVKRGVVGPDDISSGYHCMSVSFLEDQLRRSLANLDVDCIDLLYLHNVVEGQHQDVPRQELHDQLYRIMEWYESQRREGRIRYYGLATWDCFRVKPEDPRHLSLEDALAMAERAGGTGHGLRFVQLPFNMYYDQALREPTQVVRGKPGAVPGGGRLAGGGGLYQRAAHAGQAAVPRGAARVLRGPAQRTVAAVCPVGPRGAGSTGRPQEPRPRGRELGGDGDAAALAATVRGISSGGCSPDGPAPRQPRWRMDSSPQSGHIGHPYNCRRCQSGISTLRRPARPVSGVPARAAA